MRIAESSLPKKNPEANASDREVTFCSVKEGVLSLFERTAGKILLLSDERAFPALAFAARMPRAVSIVTEDALPLFTMPNVSAVLAAGGERTLRAARLFAALKRVPCILFPAECGLGGAFERAGARLNGEEFFHPLADAAVCIDENLLLPTRAEGYARTLLCRLALFEERALCRFDGAAPSEEPLAFTDDEEPPGVREIVLNNAALRRAEIAEGEGKFLAAEYGNFAAFEALIALYVAFFKYGRPRKSVVPDYEARARAAGISYADIRIPTRELLARRACILGGQRAEFLRELGLISQKNATYCRVYRSLGGETAKLPPHALKLLPERSNGLSAVIRDFGFMEKL